MLVLIGLVTVMLAAIFVARRAQPRGRRGLLLVAALLAMAQVVIVLIEVYTANPPAL